MILYLLLYCFFILFHFLIMIFNQNKICSISLLALFLYVMVYIIYALSLSFIQLFSISQSHSVNLFLHFFINDSLLLSTH